MGSSKRVKQPTLEFDQGLRNCCIRELPHVRDAMVYSDVLIFDGLRETLRLFERRTGESTDSPAIYSISGSLFFLFHSSVTINQGISSLPFLK